MRLQIDCQSVLQDGNVTKCISPHCHVMYLSQYAIQRGTMNLQKGWFERRKLKSGNFNFREESNVWKIISIENLSNLKVFWVASSGGKFVEQHLQYFNIGHFSGTATSGSCGNIEERKYWTNALLWPKAKFQQKLPFITNVGQNWTPVEIGSAN